MSRQWNSNRFLLLPMQEDLCYYTFIMQVAFSLMPEESNTTQQENTGQDMSRQEFDPSKYTLDAEEASRLFLDAGVPRSPRTIDRYCKSGHLVCMKIDTERNEKYLITSESVAARIKELQQVIPSGHVETQPDMSRHDESRPDMSRHDSMYDQTVTDEKRKLEERLAELERENLDLKITNRGKDYFVEELKKQHENFEAVRKEMTQQLIDQSRRVGELEVKVNLLEAPRHEAPRITEYPNAVIDVTPEDSKREENDERLSSMTQ
jgi:hypothetical protein